MSNRLLKLADDVERLKDQVKEQQFLIMRLMEQFNQMQLKRKPGRKPKQDGTI